MTGILLSLLGGKVSVVPDPYFEYTTLLLPGNGTNGAQNNTFLDASTNNFTITRNGNTTQGTFSPFSQTGWGNYLSGSSQYLSFTDTSNNLDLGGSQASFECWVYPISTTNYQMLFKYGGTGDWNTTNGIEYGLSLQSGVVYFYYNSSASAANINSGATTVAANTWTHIAVASNASNALSLYVNGTRVATTTAAITKPTTRTSMRIGADISNYANGYMSNYRFITGSNAYDATLSSITVPTSPVSAVTGTQLLTCQSNRFVDNSTNNFAITPNGNTSVQAFSPFNPTASWSAATYGGSGYFDGNGDYLTVPNNAAFQLGTGDFTIECWYYPQDISLVAIFGLWGPSSSNTSWLMYLDGSGNPVWYTSTNGSTQTASLTSNKAITLNAWNHIVIERSSGTTTIYVNGASGGSTSTSINLYAATSQLTVGYNPVGGTPDNVYGYLSGLRIVKGSAVYTGAFTPPTAPPTAITNTSLLLTFTNAGIYDATSKNDLETVGNAQISTAQSKWGGSSMAFDGTGDYLVGPANNFYNFGTGDFTIECWLRLNATSSAMMIASTNYNSVTGAGGWAFIYRGDISSLSLSVNSNVTYTKSWSPSTSNWYHVAASRSGSSLRLFVDGTQIGTTSTSTDNVSGSSTIVVAGNLGGGTNLVLNGYLQDLRITNYARYTSNFTAPTSPFPLL